MKLKGVCLCFTFYILSVYFIETVSCKIYKLKKLKNIKNVKSSKEDHRKYDADCFPRCMCDLTCTKDGGFVASRNWGDGNIEIYDRNFSKILPWGIPGTMLRTACGKGSELVFGDGGFQRSIRVFDNTGNYIRTIGDGILERPYGLVMVNSSTLAVGDGAKMAIVYLDYMSGALIGESPQGLVTGPWYMTMNSQNILIVSDGVVKQVKGINIETNSVVFSYSGSPGSNFSPFDVTVDDQDRIIVADNGDERITQLTSTGNLIRHIMVKGNNAQFAKPIGVEICNGTLLVGTANGDLIVDEYIP